jgi:peptidoglycan/LPS O-acetylase OafA/YrhL
LDKLAKRNLTQQYSEINLNANNNYYPYFDWLRIILAMTVALNHDEVINLPHAGNLAVQVFFALSGWLIGGILLSTKKEDLPRFFFNRVTRIWIPYAIGIALLLCASLLKDTVTPKWVEFVFYKITFVYNLFGPPQLTHFKSMMPLDGTGNHFWSICAEEQFYLLAPLLIVLLPTAFGKSRILWLLLSVFAVAGQAYGAIALGVTAAVAKHYWQNWHLNCYGILLLLIILAISSTYIGFNLATYELVAPFFAISTVILLARFGAKNRFAQFVGGMSYPFYLNHWIGAFVARELLEPYGLREAAICKALALVLNLLIAAALYYFIDNNIRKYRATWFNHSRGIYATVAAYSLMMVGLAGGLFYFNVR